MWAVDGRGCETPATAMGCCHALVFVLLLFVLLVRDLLLSCAHFEWPRKTQKGTKSFFCDFLCFLWRSLRKVWLRLLAASFNPQPQARTTHCLACGYGLNEQRGNYFFSNTSAK